jgi:beta-glucosidase
MANVGGWGVAAKKVDQFLASLSLEEKATIVTGTRGPCGGNIAPIRRINFTGLCFQDSPLGVREVDFNTVFPAGISAAASFDKDMIHRRGLYMGAEFRAKGIKIAFGYV